MAVFKQLELENHEMEKRLHQLKACMKTEKEERKRTGHRWKATEAGAADALKLRVQANASFINTAANIKLKLLKDLNTSTSNNSGKTHTNSTRNRPSKSQSHQCLRDRFAQCCICEEKKNVNRNRNIIDCDIEPLCNSYQPSYRKRRPVKSVHHQQVDHKEDLQINNTSSLLNGSFDEEGSSRYFQEAVRSWRAQGKNTQSFQTELLPHNQVIRDNKKVHVNTSTSTHKILPNVPLTINFSESSSLLYYERLLLFNRYIRDTPSPAFENNNSSDVFSSKTLPNNLNTEPQKVDVINNDDEKENFDIDRKSLYVPLVEVETYRKSAALTAQSKFFNEYKEDEKVVNLSSKASSEVGHLHAIEVEENAGTKDVMALETRAVLEESENVQVIFPEDNNSMQSQKVGKLNYLSNDSKSPVITSEDFGDKSSSWHQTETLPLPPLSSRMVSPRTNLIRPVAEISPIFGEHLIAKKRENLLPLYSPKSSTPRTPLPPSPKPPWSIKRGTIPPLDVTTRFLMVKSPSVSRSPSPLFRRNPVLRSPLLGLRSDKQLSENRLSVTSSLNGSKTINSDFDEKNITLSYENFPEKSNSSISTVSSSINEPSSHLAINRNDSTMDMLEGVPQKEAIQSDKEKTSFSERTLTPTGFRLGPNLWNPDDSILPSVNHVNFEDFGIKDYLNTETVFQEEDSVSTSGDFNIGLEIEPPNVMDGSDLIVPEEFGLPSPERTESPLLILDADTMEEQLCDTKKIQEEMMLKMNLTDVNNRLLRLSSVELNKMDQQQLDAALSIEEDYGQGSGLSSPTSELENDINAVENLK